MTAERPFYIYCHTAPNGKRYIGQTCQTLNRRWGSNGNYYRSPGPFKNAISKYGWDAFRHEVLAVCHYKSVANLLERHYIEKFDTCNPEHGYNLTTGGEGQPGIPHTEEHKRKIGESLKGHAVSDETRKKISESLKAHPYERKFSEEGMMRLRDRCGEKNPHYGHHLTDEHKKKISAFHKGRKKSPESIRKSVETKRLTGAYKTKPVDQFDLNGNLIAHHESVAAAGRAVGHPDQSIRSCCKGRYAQAFGYVWKYAPIVNTIQD